MEETEGGVGVLVGEGVEDDVDAVVGGVGAEVVFEVEGAAGGDVGGVEALGGEEVVFGGVGGGVDVGAGVLGELEGG